MGSRRIPHKTGLKEKSNGTLSKGNLFRTEGRKFQEKYYLPPLSRLRRFEDLKSLKKNTPGRMEIAVENQNGSSDSPGDLKTLKQKTDDLNGRGKQNGENGVAELHSEKSSPSRATPDKSSVTHSTPDREVRRSARIIAKEEVQNGYKEDSETGDSDIEYIEVDKKETEKKKSPEKPSKKEGIFKQKELKEKSVPMKFEEPFAPCTMTKVSGRRPLRGFLTPCQGKRKADTLDFQTPAEKRFQPETPSTQSPGWRYFPSPTSFLWRYKKRDQPDDSINDSMAVNVDETSILREPLEDIQTPDEQETKPPTSWKCNIM